MNLRPPPPVIRPALPTDLSAAAALMKRAVAHMLAQKIFQWNEAYPSEANLRADQEKGELFLIQSENDVAGIVTLNQEFPPDYNQIDWLYPGRALVVHRLAIDPLYHGKGLGRQLMHFAEEEARQRNFEVIRLDTFSKNLPALMLYEKLGYRKSGQVTFAAGQFFTFEKAVRVLR